MLNNSLKELAVAKNASQSYDNCDELDVQASVNMQKLKEWLINKGYLDIDSLKSK